LTTTSICADKALHTALTSACAAISAAATGNEGEDRLGSRCFTSPVYCQVPISNLPSLSIRARDFRRSCQGCLPHCCLIIGSPDVLHQSLFGWWQLVGLNKKTIKQTNNYYLYQGLSKVDNLIHFVT